MPRGYESRGVTRAEAQEVTWDLPPDPNWHPIAIRLYESIRTSGQGKLWQDSDWALFYAVCDDMSYIKNQGVRRSAELTKAVYTALGSLGLTEADRRRARIELAKAEAKAGNARRAYMDQIARELGVED